MSDKRLKYSVLRYTPSIVAGESINLGIVFSSIDEPLHCFVSTRKPQRIIAFDDQLEVGILNGLLASIEESVKVDISNYDSIFDIDSFVKYYVNEFHFSKPIEYPYIDFDKDIIEIEKLYLKDNFDEKQRATRRD